MTKIILASFLATLALVAAPGCGDEVDNTFDCNQICNDYDDCVDTTTDVSMCTDTCEDFADADPNAEAKVERCNDCIDDQATCSVDGACKDICAGIIAVSTP